VDSGGAVKSFPGYWPRKELPDIYFLDGLVDMGFDLWHMASYGMMPRCGLSNYDFFLKNFKRS